MSIRSLVGVLLLSIAGCVIDETGAGFAIDGGAPDAATARRDAFVPPAPEDLDGYVQWEMEQHGIPGLAAMIFRGDTTLWVGTFGTANAEAALPVTADTLFAVASISKTIVATRAMQLVELGMLDLDAPIDDYLPFAVRHPAFPEVPITMRMLLTHTSGIEDDLVMLGPEMDPGMAPHALSEFVESYVTPGGLRYGESNWGAEPGTDYSYTNAGFGVVGYVLEVAGGAPLPEQTKQGLRDPLGMSASGWLGLEVSASEMAVGYNWNGRELTPIDYEVLSYYPAGGFTTSVNELSRFVRAFMAFGELEGMRILTEASARAMREQQIPDIWDAQAIAWRYELRNGEPWLGHSGSTLGGSANMLFRPADDTAVLMLTNSDAYILARLGLTDGADALRRILDRLVTDAAAL